MTPIQLGRLVEIHNEGSIILVRPRTRKVANWLEEHTSEDAMWYGNSLVVEPRYLEPLIMGMVEDLYGNE